MPVYCQVTFDSLLALAKFELIVVKKLFIKFGIFSFSIWLLSLVWFLSTIRVFDFESGSNLEIAFQTLFGFSWFWLISSWRKSFLAFRTIPATRFLAITAVFQSSSLFVLLVCLSKSCLSLTNSNNSCATHLSFNFFTLISLNGQREL